MKASLPSANPRRVRLCLNLGRNISLIYPPKTSKRGETLIPYISEETIIIPENLSSALLTRIFVAG